MGFNRTGSFSSVADGFWANDSLIPMCTFKIRKMTVTSSEVLASVLYEKDCPLCFLFLDKILIFHYLSTFLRIIRKTVSLLLLKCFHIFETNLSTDNSTEACQQPSKLQFTHLATLTAFQFVFLVTSSLLKKFPTHTVIHYKHSPFI